MTKYHALDQIRQSAVYDQINWVKYVATQSDQPTQSGEKDKGRKKNKREKTGRERETEMERENGRESETGKEQIHSAVTNYRQMGRHSRKKQGKKLPYKAHWLRL